MMEVEVQVLVCSRHEEKHCHEAPAAHLVQSPLAEPDRSGGVDKERRRLVLHSVEPRGQSVLVEGKQRKERAKNQQYLHIEPREHHSVVVQQNVVCDNAENGPHGEQVEEPGGLEDRRLADVEDRRERHVDKEEDGRQHRLLFEPGIRKSNRDP